VLLLDEVVLETCFACMRLYRHPSGWFGFIVSEPKRYPILVGS
jgi:hypothetical protein